MKAAKMETVLKGLRESLRTREAMFTARGGKSRTRMKMVTQGSEVRRVVVISKDGGHAQDGTGSL